MTGQQLFASGPIGSLFYLHAAIFEIPKLCFMIKPLTCWGTDVSIEIYELLLLFSIISPWFIQNSVRHKLQFWERFSSVSTDFNNKVFKEKYVAYAFNKYCKQFLSKTSPHMLPLFHQNGVTDVVRVLFVCILPRYKLHKDRWIKIP